jgi:Recombinase zinc beta ribbon domain/Recombinase
LPLRHHRVLEVLHNPRYAGAFAYGRRRQRRGPDGRTRHALRPREEWTVLILNAHPGYITWDAYEDNLRRLAECAQSHGADRRASPAREGPALLQGLAICGRCGGRMTVRYHTRRGHTVPEYRCQRAGIENGSPVCAAISGEGVDAAVGQLLLATVTPVALEVALAVQAELEGRAAEADGLRRQHVERARHVAEQARRRYLAVDPDNRLVAANLEADWNEALRCLHHAQEDYERQAAKAAPLGDHDKARIVALASDFPALWSDPRTPQRERKRMVRLLVDDVTLIRDHHIAVHVRFKGGQATSLEVAVGLPAPDARRTSAEVIAHIDRLLDHHTEAGVAAELNQAGIVSSTGQAFHAGIVHHLRVQHRLASREQRLRARGLVGLEEAAARLGVCTQTVKRWHHEGRLAGEPLNDKGSQFYSIPAVAPRKKLGRPPEGSRPRDTRPSAGG